MNEFQPLGYGQQQQLAPQGFFGSMIGAPLGGAIGRGIGGLLGGSHLGGQIGQWAGGIGGGFLPFSADPVSAAYAQAQQQMQQGQPGQLAPQGWFGNVLGHVAKPLGGAIGGLFGNSGLGSTIGGFAGNLGGMLPFSVDPVSAAIAQQQMQQVQQGQLAPQGWFGNVLGHVAKPLGGAIGGLFGNSGLGSTIGGIAGGLGGMLPFSVDPVSAAIAQQQMQQQMQQAQQAQQVQQGQLAPQGWFGNVLGHVAKPLGGAIGGLFGNSGLGSTIGGFAGNLGGMLPFSADPAAVAQPHPLLQQMQQQQQLQQLQQQQQQQQQQQLQQMQQMQQLAQQQAMQGQMAPQGWFGNLVGQFGQPVGSAIGGMLGNQQLGSSLGGVASQLGRMLPFQADPWSAYVQQQLASQQMQQPFYPGMQPGQPTGQQVPAAFAGQQTLH